MNPKSEIKIGWWLRCKKHLTVRAGVLLLCLAAASRPAQTYPAVFLLRRGDWPDLGFMKAILAILTLIGMSGTCLGQGTVNWAGISAAAITAQTNTQQFSPIFSGGATNPGAIGPTAPASSGLVYYYELLYNTNFTGSQVPAPDAVSLLDSWLDTGLTATNSNAAGWLLPVNPHIAALVPWDPWTTNNIMVVGWSANLGTSWAAVKIKLANWNDYSSSIMGEAFFGESATGYIAPNIASPGSMVFGTGPTTYGLPIYSPNLQLYWLPPPATAAPVIVGQPTNQNVRFGTTANISVGAVSAAPMIYQWFLGTNAFLATTNSALCLTNVQPSQAGSYTAVVTNLYGAATSAPAVLTVSAEPIIQNSFTNQQAIAGDTVNLSVVATGWLPMDYHWLFGRNVVLETTNSVLCLTNVQPSQAGSYTAVVTNVYGAATSAPALLTVKSKPVIEDSPMSQQVFVGDSVNFSVVVEGKPPFAYQWVFGTNAIDWAMNSTIQLTNVQPWQAGAYTVVVTNVYGAETSAPAMLTVVAAGVVTSCTEASLRAAMAGGGTVTFACDGTITLANTIVVGTNTKLNGSGHAVTIRSGNSARVFYVNTNVTFSVVNLTIANGRGTNGAGIFNAGGTVNLNGVTFCWNYALLGGAIYNAGQMNVESCCFTNNEAWAFFGESATYGGAIYNAGSMNLDLCQFSGNSADGNEIISQLSYAALGGAIYNSGHLTIDRTTLNSNTASGGSGYRGVIDYQHTMNGGNGSSGANAFGGAICNAGSLSISRSTLYGNTAAGGYGGDGASGVSFMDLGGSGGNGGNGATGAGGAVYGVGSFVNCTIAFNNAQGGSGGYGGNGYGAVPGQSGRGGNGGNGGSGICGGVSGGSSFFINCTMVRNSSVAGIAGGAGLGSIGLPISGSPGSSGSASGGGESGPTTLCFSNTPERNDTFANPKLGPLADNGGPTLTMALLPGSPAIDAGSAVGAPPTDQRGAVRPSGVGCDIGAYEWSPPSVTIPPPTQTAEIGTTVELTAKASTFPPTTYQWFFNGNAITGCTKCVLCLSGVQATNVGAYTFVVRNIDGVKTSSPAMLNVIPVVERRPVPAVKVAGEAGSLLNVDYANSLSPSPNWTALGSVTLTSTSQFCPDVTMPLPAARFYRAWQMGTPSVVPTLNLNFIPTITLTGNVGDSLHLDYINQFGPTNAWVTLDTVMLTNMSQLYFDVGAPGQPARLYRIVPAP